MPRIIAIRYRLKGLASYDPERDIIIYDRNLDKFPGFKRKVIEHELDHVESCKGKPSFFKNLKREILDYPKIYFDDEYYRFRAYEMNEGKKKEFGNKNGLKMFILEMIVTLYSSFLTAALLPLYIYKIRKAQRPR
jgi:hypothetical protein